jgi:DNA-binding CsgD family transcriptional regulator
MTGPEISSEPSPRTSSRATALRGRDAELGEISEQLAGIRAGSGSIILVEGGPGFGKSRLLDEAARIAARLPVRVGAAAAEPRDSVVPMRPLMKALFEGEEPILERSALPDLRASAEQLYWLLHEIETLLEQAALRTPLLVCLDDMQWADRATVAALRALPGWLASLPIAWIAAFRPGELSSELADALSWLERLGAKRLELQLLDREAVRQIVSDVLGVDASEALLDVAAGAQGNPFLLMELLLGLGEEGLIAVRRGGADVLEARLPARLRENMRYRLERMSAVARRTAVVAAVLGQSVSFEHLVAMLALVPSELLEPVAQLKRADILIESGEALAFRHDIIRQAVLNTIPGSARRALDRQAAEMLLAEHALPLEIAARLADSAAPGDQVAITTLHQAAKALATTDPATASELSRKAFALTPDGASERVPLVKETLLLLHAAGREAEATMFADEVLRDVLSPEEEVEVRLSIAAMYSLRADLRVDAGRIALALPEVSKSLRARVLATHVLSLVADGRLSEAREVAHEAQAAVNSTADEHAIVGLEFGLLALDEAEQRYGQMLERARAIHRLGKAAQQDAIVRAAEWLLTNALAGLGQLDEALALTRDGLASAQRDRQGWMAPRWEMWRGRFLLQTGRISDARAALEGVFADEQLTCPVTIPDAAGALALGRIAIHTGDERQSIRCTEIARAGLELDRTDASRQLTWMLALQAMARGEPDVARAELAAGADDANTSILPLLARDVCDEPQLVRLAIAAADGDLARLAVATAEERERLNPGVSLIAAAAAHARGLSNADLTDLQTAVDLLQGGPRPLVLASALEDLGRQLAKQAAREPAVTALGQALEIYAEAGACWDESRVRIRLRGLGVRRRLVPAQRPQHSWEALTDSELKVVRLIATGMTNRDAANKLYLSPHTVSTHLRHAFTKLGINSRTELTRIAVEQERVAVTDA